MTPIQLVDDVIYRDFGGEIVFLRLCDGAFFTLFGDDAVGFRAMLYDAASDHSLAAELMGESLIEPVRKLVPQKALQACVQRRALVASGRTTDFSDVTPNRPGAPAFS